jgi:mycothiol synthase
VDALVLGELTPAQLADLAGLLARCEKADGFPPFSEPQQKAAAQPDLGHPDTRAVLQYADDALVGCAILSPGHEQGEGESSGMSLHVAVDPDHRARGTGTNVRLGLIATALTLTPGPIHLWIMRAVVSDDQEMQALGFRPERDLWQMRVPLPLPRETVAAAPPVATRAFVPGQDDAAWLAVNNRAFAGHPEQGGWTMEELQLRQKADWFDPEGFLVADDPDGAGDHGLKGSCWTKIHRHTTPELGEIYVISVDPSQHGRGLGKALTVAGLEWLAAQGITVGMLYTDADNEAAVALYEHLGFSVHQVDREYLRAGGVT